MTGVAPGALAGAMRVGGALLLLPCLGCDPADTGEVPEPSRCEALVGRSGVHELELSADEGTISAELALPEESAEAAPVVLQVFGAWDPSVVPEGENTTIQGAITLRVALAGTTWGDGSDDKRGPLARAAFAAALRYAADQAEDTDGCSIVGRAPLADVDARVVFAQSNGGNLVLATLADPALEAPAPVGVVLWETPAGAQFVNQEAQDDARLYTPGSCTFAAATGVTCPLPTDRPPLAVDDGLCFDVDEDGACTEADLREKAPPDPETGRYAGSVTLAQAIAADGLHVQWNDATQADRFWAVRDAARAAAAVVERHPDLAFLLLASESDHVLAGLADHPHVYGLGEALQSAGARWVRLNPGVWWSGLGNENAPNRPLRLAEPDAWLIPEADEAPLGGVATAAVQELVDRTHSADW